MSIEPDEVNTIRLTGPVTLYEVSDVCETLRAALSNSKPIRIDLSDSGPWDLAGIQVLISCVASARNRELELDLVGVPSICSQVAERAGLSGWLAAVLV